MIKIESFELDHDIVVAPYVRKVSVFSLSKESCDCMITKFDIRFTQPNKDYLANNTIHTLEHLIATYMRSYTDKLIDISPMGCRTGFYCIMSGDVQPSELVTVIQKALEDVISTQSIPGATQKECGNFKDHSLENAKQTAKEFLSSSTESLLSVYGS